MGFFYVILTKTHWYMFAQIIPFSFQTVVDYCAAREKEIQSKSDFSSFDAKSVLTTESVVRHWLLFYCS